MGWVGEALRGRMLLVAPVEVWGRPFQKVGWLVQSGSEHQALGEAEAPVAEQGGREEQEVWLGPRGMVRGQAPEMTKFHGATQAPLYAF